MIKSKEKRSVSLQPQELNSNLTTKGTFTILSVSGDPPYFTCRFWLE